MPRKERGPVKEGIWQLQGEIDYVPKAGMASRIKAQDAGVETRGSEGVLEP
jgi:hypothetical protein